VHCGVDVGCHVRFHHESEPPSELAQLDSLDPLSPTEVLRTEGGFQN
jgi:hypothetical protein